MTSMTVRVMIMGGYDESCNTGWLVPSGEYKDGPSISYLGYSPMRLEPIRWVGEGDSAGLGYPACDTIRIKTDASWHS